MLKIYFMDRFQKADDERIYYIKCNKYRNLKILKYHIFSIKH